MVLDPMSTHSFEGLPHTPRRITKKKIFLAHGVDLQHMGT